MFEVLHFRGAEEILKEKGGNTAFTVKRKKTTVEFGGNVVDGKGFNDPDPEVQ